MRDKVLSKGVDSVGEGFKDPVAIVKALAKKERMALGMLKLQFSSLATPQDASLS
jgi:hypothetical protein